MKRVLLPRLTTRKLALALAIAGAIFATTAPSRAQTQVYSENFEVNSGNFVTNTLGGANYADTFFDYSTVGIPSAPHSAAATFHGVKLAANLDAGVAQFPSGISVSPLGFSITENFEMHFDMWANFNGPMPAGGSGSTQFGGAGYGTAATSAQAAGGSFDSVVVGVTVDGNSSADYRMYAPNVSASYQDADHIIRTDLTTPLVYFCGSRANNGGGNYYVTNFPSVTVPAAQLALYPQQTNSAGGGPGTNQPGSLSFGWHDVAVKKVATIITFKIDGKLIATANTGDAGTLGGGNIVFTHFDSNAGASTDPNRTNLCFTLIDNVRITNFPSVVSVTASTPAASEAGQSPGVFTITRTEPGPAITVHYTMSGTATNGVDYTNALGGALSGTVTLKVGETSTNITIIPIDDNIPELTETVILTINDDPAYIGAGDATVTITDNDPVTIDVLAVQPTMYERHPNDFIKFRLQRRGDLAPAVASVSLTYSGTGFVPTNNIPVDAGAATADFMISPVDNGVASGPKTVTVTVASGGGYAVGTTTPSATGTILDDETPPATVLYSNPLTSAADAVHWGITYGNGDPVNLPTDYNVDFGYDLTTDPGGHGVIPLPPSGATTALRITCNKQVNPGAAGAVNVYYTNQAFSGNYAARFSMNVIQGGDLNTGSEGVIFGVNHTGSQSNWWYGSGPIAGGPWGSDGIWYYISADAGSDLNGDYEEFTGIGGTNGNAGWQRISGKFAAAFVDNFKNSPGAFTCLNTLNNATIGPSGVPINGSPLLALDASNWADVEIKQINNVVTMSIDRTPVFTYTNTTVWTGGYLMLGYTDPYGGVGGVSVGNPDAAAYFSNLRVVRLGTVISGLTLGGGNVIITYTTADADDTTTSYALQSAINVAGPYNDVTPAATFTQLAAGSFQAVTAQGGSATFYRLRHK
jgi:hypothetical protein